MSKSSKSKLGIKRYPYRGLFVGLTIVLCWFLLLSISLNMELDFSSPLTYLILLLQTHLFTGLFITAHDSMHGTVCSNKGWNSLMGYLTCFLYAFFFLPKLKRLHFKHHDEVVGEEDPDYFDGNFFQWYFDFFRNYVSWSNFLLYAIVFNVLKLFLPTPNLLFFWILPALLSTFQLFYFGTYLPHRNENHHLPHSAGSQSKNHVLAFLSCYFFGYHQEHHEAPSVPWWQLYLLKE